jgi:Mrp family chromosome partitioning ATPase
MKSPEFARLSMSLSDGRETEKSLSVPMKSEDVSLDIVNREGEHWAETLSSAARLTHVLGTGRRVVAVSCFDAKDRSGGLAARLAAGLAEIDTGKVLVLDANSRASEIAGLLSVPNTPGFQDVLEGRVEVRDAVRQLKPSNLWVMPLGAGSGPLMSLLTTPRCSLVMNDLREHFRYILADAGTVHSAESVLFASLSDGVLLSLAAGLRTRDEVANLRDALLRLQIPLLGAILTKRTSGRS